MSEALFNVIGLGLNVIGGVIIFIWGPPQPSFERAVLLGINVTPEADAKYEAQAEARERRHRIMSRVGLGLIIIGFLLQLPIALRPVLGI